MDVEVAARNFVDHDGRLQNLDELVRMVNSLQPSYPPPAAHEIQELVQLLVAQFNRPDGGSHADEWRKAVALANDVDARYTLFSAKFYGCVLDCLPNQIADGDHVQHICLVALLSRMIQCAEFALGSEQNVAFLLDRRLYVYFVLVLQSYGSSTAVMEHVQWLPYFASAHCPQYAIWLTTEPESVRFVRTFCLKIAGCQTLALSRPLVQTSSKLLVSWLTAFQKQVPVLVDIAEAMKAVASIAKQPNDALLQFIPAVIGLLHHHHDNPALLHHFIHVLLAIDLEVLNMMCWSTETIGMDTLLALLRIAKAHPQQAPTLCSASFRLLMRLCCTSRCASLIANNGQLFTTVMNEIRDCVNNVEAAGDVGRALRMLTLLTPGPPSEMLGVLMLERMLEVHRGSEEILECIVSTMALLCAGQDWSLLSGLADLQKQLVATPWTPSVSSHVGHFFKSGMIKWMIEGYIGSTKSIQLSLCVLKVLHSLVTQAEPNQKEELLRERRLQEVVHCLVLAIAPGGASDASEAGWRASLMTVISELMSDSHLLAVALSLGWAKTVITIGESEESFTNTLMGRVLLVCSLDLLGKLSVTSDKEKSQMLDADAHIFYTKHMQTNPWMSVALRASQGFCILLVNSKVKHLAMDNGAVESLLTVLRRFSDNSTVSRIGLLCLAALSLSDRAYKELLIERGVHRVVHEYLSDQRNSTIIHTLAVVVLLRLLMDDGDVNDVAVLPGLQESVLEAVNVRPLLHMDNSTADLLQCGFSLLANVFCSTVFTQLLSHDVTHHDLHVFQLSIYNGALLKYLGLDLAHVSTAFERHAQPLVSSRLSGVALHTCPNCRSGLASEMILTFPQLTPDDYEALAELGWFRRGGIQFFQFRSNHASACNTGEIRVRVKEFDPDSSRAFSRVRRRCRAAGVQVKVVKPMFQQESFDLYYRYQVDRHESEFCSQQSYRSHLLQSPLPHVMSEDGVVEYGTFHYQYWVGDHLAGVSVIDILPHSLNSIYMFFDVEKQYSRLSLGVYSCLKELELAQELNSRGADIRYYYLGNFCPTNRKLAYKSDYQPAEVLCAHISTYWSAHTKTSGSPLFAPGLPHNPLQDHTLREAVENETAEVIWREQPGSAEMQRAYCLPALVQKSVNNISSPYLRFLARFPDREKCDPSIGRLRVSVNGKEMSFGMLLLTYFVHPCCVGPLCWTMEELLAGVGKDLFEKLIVHFNVSPGCAMAKACNQKRV